MQQIVWENRKKFDIGNDCLVSIDGMDCLIKRPGTTESILKSFFSYKSRSSGLRYEVGLCIRTGDIVWVIGPFPPGDWVDVEIFRFALQYMLDENERVEADDGYIGEDPRLVKVPASVWHDKEMAPVRGRVRHWQETANKRLKQFNVLAAKFYHDIEFHRPCFMSCTVLTQLCINNNHPLFETADYRDTRRNLP